MESLSKNGLGIFILFISVIGLDISQADLLTTWNVLGQIVSFILLIWNQWTRKDVDMFFFKK